jgi:hypothetical protein
MHRIRGRAPASRPRRRRCHREPYGPSGAACMLLSQAHLARAGLHTFRAAGMTVGFLILFLAKIASGLPQLHDASTDDSRPAMGMSDSLVNRPPNGHERPLASTLSLPAGRSSRVRARLFNRARHVLQLLVRSEPVASLTVCRNALGGATSLTNSQCVRASGTHRFRNVSGSQGTYRHTSAGSADAGGQ